jgi:D-alanyl-D-alanine carboxypeptidase
VRLRTPLLLLLTTTLCAPLRADLTADLDAIAGRYYQAGEPGAAVLVRKGGKTLLRKAYGQADLELSVPLSADNVFRIGSVTKQFTAVAILQLVQRGKIALDDDLGKLLPGYPAPAKRITLEHLLTHTSGIPSYTSLPSHRKTMRLDTTPEEMIARFRDLPLEFDPGTRYSYSNSNYILLGSIVEKHSGLTYAGYVKRHLFEPAGMTASRYDENDLVIPRRAHGYSQDGTRWINTPYLSMTVPFAAGGLVSTVDDLAKWSDALRGGKLVDPKLLARAHTAFKTADGTSIRYGYGWRVTEYEGHRIIEHGGAINGFSSDLLMMPDDDLTVVVLQNGNREPAPEWLGFQLAAAAIGKPYPPAPIAMTTAQLDRYTGTYRLDETRANVVTREGDRLVFQAARGPRFELLPLSETEFFATDFPTRIRFTMTGGRPARLMMVGYGGAEVSTRVDWNGIVRAACAEAFFFSPS